MKAKQSPIFNPGDRPYDQGRLQFSYWVNVYATVLTETGQRYGWPLSHRPYCPGPKHQRPLYRIRVRPPRQPGLTKR